MGNASWSEWQLQSGGTGGGGDTLPIGTILPFTSDTVPVNYLLADGSLVSRTEYSELFAIIGTTYGEGDGSTTFALPDMRSRVAVGKDVNDTDFNEIGKIGGEKKHTLTIDEMPSHTHNDGVTSNFFGQTGGQNSCIVMADKSKGKTSATGRNQPHNIMQPYVVTNYIIKAKMSASLTGQVIDSLDGDSTTDAPSVNTVKKGLKTNIVIGQEIATNEYIDDKQVFVKKINCGNLPNNTEKTYETGLDISKVTIIKIEGIAKHSNNTSIPLNFYNGFAYISANINNMGKLSINTNTDRSDATGYANIYYTKNK